MVRWGQASPSIDIEAVSNRVYRTDLFRVAASEIGIACPDIDRLPPGGHGEPLAPEFDRPGSATVASPSQARG